MPGSAQSGKGYTGIKDKKVRIMKHKGKQTTGGAPLADYTDLYGYTLWANFRSLSGREYTFAMGVEYAETVIFTVNHHPEIEPGMYVTWKDRAYKILYIDSREGYKSDIILHCEAGIKLTTDVIKDLGDVADGPVGA
jgi:SPP1 family predicted phage head-tail adaptor